jgi:hypothetical protein
MLVRNRHFRINDIGANSAGTATRKSITGPVLFLYSVIPEKGGIINASS